MRFLGPEALKDRGDRLAKAAGAIDKRELSPSFLTADTVTHATRAPRAIPSSVDSIASSNADDTKRKPCSGIVNFPNVGMKLRSRRRNPVVKKDHSGRELPHRHRLESVP